MKVSQTHMMDRLSAEFDEDGLVPNAGVGLVDQLAAHLGVHGLVDAGVTVDGVGGAKAMTAVCAMALGADSIDDVDLLRVSGTDQVLGFVPRSASTLGRWLRWFSHGNVRQLESVVGAALERSWLAGAGPCAERLFLDADSSVVEVYGGKQGAAWSYNNIWSLHPLFVTRGGTGEVVAARLRRGNASSADGAEHLLAEAVNRARRGGASGEIVVRADTAFYSEKLVRRLVSLGVRYSISAPDDVLIRDYVGHIPDKAWKRVPYRGGIAEVAETLWEHPRLGRIIVRRVKNVAGQDPQGRLFEQRKHIAFVTNRSGDPVLLDREHRQRAAQETSAIRELKENALRHLPSASFAANAAWLQLACLAHNLTRQIQLIARLGGPIRTQATIRMRLLSLCGRIIRSGRRCVLRLPRGWPWQHDFDVAHRRIRGVMHTS